MVLVEMYVTIFLLYYKINDVTHSKKLKDVIIIFL